MKLGNWGWIFLLMITAAHADEKGKCGKDCEPPRPPRQVCFNLVCNYQKGDDPGFTKCQAAATFTKWVTADGGEIQDFSSTPDNPNFEVECDDQVVYNSSAHRFTDEQGTRIQAESGPYPAIQLPNRALEDTHHYQLSRLELGNQSLTGYCYLWTGQP